MDFLWLFDLWLYNLFFLDEFSSFCGIEHVSSISPNASSIFIWSVSFIRLVVLAAIYFCFCILLLHWIGSFVEIFIFSWGISSRLRWRFRLGLNWRQLLLFLFSHSRPFCPLAPLLRLHFSLLFLFLVLKYLACDFTHGHLHQFKHAACLPRRYLVFHSKIVAAALEAHSIVSTAATILAIDNSATSLPTFLASHFLELPRRDNPRLLALWWLESRVLLDEWYRVEGCSAVCRWRKWELVLHTTDWKGYRRSLLVRLCWASRLMVQINTTIFYSWRHQLWSRCRCEELRIGVLLKKFKGLTRSGQHHSSTTSNFALIYIRLWRGSKDPSSWNIVARACLEELLLLIFDLEWCT